VEMTEVEREESVVYCSQSTDRLQWFLVYDCHESISREFRVVLLWELLYADDDLVVIAETRPLCLTAYRSLMIKLTTRVFYCKIKQDYCI